MRAAGATIWASLSASMVSSLEGEVEGHFNICGLMLPFVVY